jgi:long-subunit acyl-CoA synthetase (AMP-forming)
VLSNVRAMLGLDEIEACNVGAAPTPPEVIEFFHALGVPLAELWGMSETTGAGTCNPPDKIKIGTVGPPAPSIEIKLAEDGEVLVKGPCVMAGYRNQPEKTKETFTDDGFLMTGDIGEFDEDGYLKIVDRKKELIINAAGKNMSPANIESKLKSAGPLIGQAIAIGDRRPYNVALLTLDPDTAGDKSPDDPDVVKAVEEEVEKANADLARVEQIKKFKILDKEWEPGGDELTPTMKLKRKPIAEKYEAEIEALYAK